MKKHRTTALMLALAMLLSALLTGCGGGGGSASGDTTYSWWIYSGADSMYYSEYQENPAVQYTAAPPSGHRSGCCGRPRPIWTAWRRISYVRVHLLPMDRRFA